MWIIKIHKQNHSVENMLSRAPTQQHDATVRLRIHVYVYIEIAVVYDCSLARSLCVCVEFVYIIQDRVDCVNRSPLNSNFIIIDAV